MTGEQQEAVCGTCGRTLWPLNADEHQITFGHPFIPAPVVPSDDDERVTIAQIFGMKVTRQKTREEMLRDGDLIEVRGIVDVPPTPSQDAESVRNDSDRPQRSLSQDAEGGGPRPGYVRIRTGEGDNYRDWDIPEVIESAIREPYEALVQAARDYLDNCFHVITVWRATGRLVERCGTCSSCRVRAALTRIEESLGGRK